MTRRTLATAVLPLAVIILSSVTASIVASRLPDRIVVHWGPRGEADGFASPLAFIVGMALISGLVWGVTAAVASVGRRAVAGGRFLGGFPLGIVSFMSFVGLATVLIQLDGDRTTLPGWLIPGAVAAGAAGWVLASWVHGPSDAPPSTSAPAPASAPRYPLAAGSTAVWRGTTPPSTVIAVLSLVVAVAGLVMGWLLVPGVAFIMLPVALLLAVSTRFVVTVGPAGIRVAPPVIPVSWVRVPLDQVAAAEAGSVDAWSFGGLGVRIGTGGETAVITRSGPALVVHRTDGAVLRISLDDPAQPAAVLASLLDRRA